MTYLAYLFTSEIGKVLEHSVFLGGASQGQALRHESVKLGKNSEASGIWGWGKDESVWCGPDGKRA